MADELKASSSLRLAARRGCAMHGRGRGESTFWRPSHRTLSTLPALQKTKQAKGNAAFSAGEFEEAIKYFSEAIDKDGSNHVLYSNRSAAEVRVCVCGARFFWPPPRRRRRCL